VEGAGASGAQGRFSRRSRLNSVVVR
jgi:hypothetical protein